MMKKAKEANCNSVKFQSFDENVIKSHPEKNRLLKSSINSENIEEIDHLSKLIGIEWFCTPMYPKAVDLLDPHIKKWKIRYSDSKLLLENRTSELIDKIFNTNKEIIVSTQKSPKKSNFYLNKKIKWLYVIPKYPCELSDLDFSDFQDFDGYSNHCPHFLGPLTASILGAKIIEIHITSDKTKNYLDNNVSFDYNELTRLTNLIRLSESIKK